MIGVISKSSELDIVKEFFELFKTPWEFYQNNNQYDAVLTTGESVEGIKSKLVILYGSKTTKFDRDNKIETQDGKSRLILEYEKKQLPIYGNLLTFGIKETELIKVKGTEEIAGIKKHNEGQVIVRIGYDIFQEIQLMLTKGQDPEYAHIPTIEIHISILRDFILNSGIPLIEVPPVPAGYAFTVCLTHDVDFVGIRRHKLDRTMFGFIYRALFGSLASFVANRTPLSKVVKNWKAVLSLPGVYLGILKDPMVQFKRYLEIEEGLGSTFYFIPYKNRAGRGISGSAPSQRKTRYDVDDVENEIKELIDDGCEIGLHGIESWHDSQKGAEELDRIKNISKEPDVGIRMHWLFFSNRSPQILESSGFLYDTTFGYNETIGYRGGLMQVFRPMSVKKLLELPLHIQDTALFYSGRMGLTEEGAWGHVKKMLRNSEMYGGVLTLNWHHRSIGPERLWDEFYIKLIDKLKKLKVWFGTAKQAVNWFNKRRSVSFDTVGILEDKLQVKIMSAKDADTPDLVLRVQYMKKDDSSPSKVYKIDVPFTGELSTVISL